MPFVVMLERHRQILHCRSGIRTWHNADVVTLHGLHEAFCHAITLRTTHRCSFRLQPQQPGEPPRFMRSVGRAVVCQPLDGGWRKAVSEATLHRAQHYVLNGITVEATGASGPVQRLAVTAVQSEGDAEFFTVITAELEPVRTPPSITFTDGHFSGMCPTYRLHSGFSFQQQRMLAHDPVHPFGVDDRHCQRLRFAAQ